MKQNVLQLLWKSYLLPLLPDMCCFCLVCFFTSQSTAMGISGWSAHLTTLFSWVSLTNQLTFVHILSLVTDNNPSGISGREENGRRNYFVINLRKSMGPGLDRTPSPWISSQTRNCSQTLRGPVACDVIIGDMIDTKLLMKMQPGTCFFHIYSNRVNMVVIQDC